MRSKEVENAIERLKNGKNTAYIGSNTAIYFIKDVDTILSYIEELEKDNIELRKYYATRKEVEDLKDTINCLHESSKEYINKDKIRDKIKELEELWQEFNEDYYSDGMLRCEYQIDLLKELIDDKSKNVWVD